MENLSYYDYCDVTLELWIKLGKPAKTNLLGQHRKHLRGTYLSVHWQNNRTNNIYAETYVFT